MRQFDSLTVPDSQIQVDQPQPVGDLELIKSYHLASNHIEVYQLISTHT